MVAWLQFHQWSADELMLLIVILIHSAKRQTTAATDKDGSMKKAKLNSTKKAASFVNFDNW